MLCLPLFALLFLVAPATAQTPRGSFDSVVPSLPDGYGTGRVSIRVHAVPLPQDSSSALAGDLFARTGVAITETHGVRIELVLPADLRFESMHARVVDGLVLQPEGRSFLGQVGSALVSLLRLLLVGRLVTATDDLVVSGAAWAAALGAPDPQEELVRLNSSETLSVDRSASAFSDHGAFVVCRALFAFSPWTELVDIQLRCTDQVTGKPVAFLIPRLSLHPEPDREPARGAESRLAAARVVGGER